jgi:hypothetical protein
MENGRFDVFQAESGRETQVKNTADERSFIIEGKDALRGTKAVEALAGMFNNANIDDVSLELPFSIQDPVIRIDSISDMNVGEAFNISGITNLGEENKLHVEVTPSAQRKFFAVGGLRMLASIRRGEMGENRWSTDTTSVLTRPQEYEVNAMSDKGISATAKFSIKWRDT